jgi:hypothetical protein
MSMDERFLRSENALAMISELAAKSEKRHSVEEQRLDKLTQILDEKMAALADAQIRTESALTNLADGMNKMAAAQVHTDQRLDALIDIMNEGRGR